MATEADKVNTGALATILSVGALAMLGISAAVTALVRYEAEATTVAKGGSANLRGLMDTRTKDSKELAEPVHWTNRNKALVGVPLDRAVKLVLDDLQRDPNSATPPPPEPKDKKKLEEEPKPDDELGVLEPTDDESATAAATETAAPDKPGDGDQAAKPKKKPAAPAPGAPAAPQPAPAQPTPAPESAPVNAP